MSDNHDVMRDSLRHLLGNQDSNAIRTLLSEEHPMDILNYVRIFSTEDIITIIRALPIRDQATLFGYFPHDIQVDMAQTMKRGDLIRIITNMSHDERADMFSSLSPEQQDALLPGLAQAEREDIRKLAAYPEEQAGSAMTSDYATLLPDFTKEEAIAHLSKIAPETETIYQAFVVNKERVLIGTISLRTLILAKAGTRVEKIMIHDPIHVQADAPRADAVRLIADYDLMVLPVTDSGNKLVGIITHDDAMDVATAETTDDFHKLGGVSEMPPLKTGASTLTASLKNASIFMLYRMRIFWLILLVFGHSFSAAGIAYFEDIIASYVILVFFLPLLIGSGGNAGSQAATLMVRALATGDVELRDWHRVIFREIFVAALLGLSMALAVSFLGFYRGGWEIASVVAFSMVLIVLVGSLIGMTLPFILSRLGLDPATASAPLVTSLADAVGVIIYFSIASTFLNLNMP